MANKTDNKKEKKQAEISGTFFDLDAMDGTWFDFFKSHINDDGKTICDDPAPNAGKICLRSMIPFIEEMQAKRKTKSKMILNKSTRAMERLAYTEDLEPNERKQYQNDLWDYAIVDFENFFDVNGKEIECTLENKLRLMKVPMFDRFVAKCLKSIGENAVKEAKDLNENL